MESTRPRARGGDAAPPAQVRNRSVLVIEDDPLLAGAMVDVLRDAEFDAEGLPGIEGIGRAMDGDPFLIVLDVSLHRSDAVDVIQALDERGYHGSIQLVSGGGPALLARVKRVGERRGMTMLPVLCKPFAMGDLRVVAERESRAVRDSIAIAAPRAAVASAAVPPSVALELALDEGWVEVWYQPQYDARSLSLAGAECLCRVIHPEHGVLSPGAFLPGAGPADMWRLTELVLRRACEDWTLFDAAGLGLRLSINIPCRLLATMPLARLLRQWMPKAEHWPGLVLEVTEEEALRDVDAVHEVSTQLEIHGVDLSVDDFGTGYSSLARLRDVSFKEVKLDRTLVDGCGADGTRAALCRAIVELSHTLGATTVAEGIERPDDLACVRDIGCDAVQGFLLARPMTRDLLCAEIRIGRARTGARLARDPLPTLS